MKGRLTQQDIAAGVGVSQPTVQRWLTGSTMPGGAELFRLAKFLGIKVEDFFENGGTPAACPMLLRESPPDYAVEDLLQKVDDLVEQAASIKRAAQRLNKK